MSYTPTNWQMGDTITASLLNKIEGGIVGSSELTVLNIKYEQGMYSIREEITSAEFRDLCLNHRVCLNYDRFGTLCYLNSFSEEPEEYFIAIFCGNSATGYFEIRVYCDLTDSGVYPPSVDYCGSTALGSIAVVCEASGTSGAYVSEDSASQIFTYCSRGAMATFLISGTASGDYIYRIVSANSNNSQYTFVCIDMNGNAVKLGPYASSSKVSFTIT